MVELITVLPPVDTDQNRGYKFPFKASEVFSCETPNILDTVIYDAEILEFFLNFLNYEPLNLTLAGYFSKLLISLISRNPSKILTFMDSHGSLVKLSEKISSKSISDIVLKILTLNIQDSQCLEARKTLFELVLDRLGNCEDPYTATFLYEIISEFISKSLEVDSWKEIFRIAIVDKEPVIFEAAQSESAVRVYIAVRVLTDILNSSYCDSFLVLDEPEDDSSMDVDGGPTNFFLRILDCFENFIRFLSGFKEPWKSTSKDVAVKVFGKEGLAIIVFFTKLLKYKYRIVEEKFSSFGIIPKVIDLLFQFEHNSFLHAKIENFISTIFLQKGSNDCYIEALLGEPLLKLMSNENLKKPFSGYLVRIFNIIEKNTNDIKKFNSRLNESNEWKEFSLNIKEKNEIFCKKLGVETETHPELPNTGPILPGGAPSLPFGPSSMISGPPLGLPNPLPPSLPPVLPGPPQMMYGLPSINQSGQPPFHFNLPQIPMRPPGTLGTPPQGNPIPPPPMSFPGPPPSLPNRTPPFTGPPILPPPSIPQQNFTIPPTPSNYFPIFTSEPPRVEHENKIKPNEEKEEEEKENHMDIVNTPNPNLEESKGEFNQANFPSTDLSMPEPTELNATEENSNEFFSSYWKFGVN